MLIRVRDVVVRDTLKRDLTYVALAEHCFGPAASRVVFFLLVFSSIGSNGAYLVFIGSVLSSIAPQLSAITWSGVTACAMVPVVLARRTSFLAYTSAAGNVGVALVVAAVLAQGSIVGNIGPASDYADFTTSSYMAVRKSISCDKLFWAHLRCHRVIAAPPIPRIGVRHCWSAVQLLNKLTAN